MENRDMSPNTSEILQTVQTHLQAIYDLLEATDLEIGFTDTPEYASVSSLHTRVALLFERKAAEHFESACVAAEVYNPESDRTINTTVFDVQESRGTKRGLVKYGRGVKAVYYSKMLSKWCIIS